MCFLLTTLVLTRVTPCFIHIPYIIAAFLVIEILKDIHTKAGVAMLAYWMIWYCYCFLSGFKCTFSCIVQYSLYLNMDIGTMWHCTLVSSTPSQSIELFVVCAVLVSVIRCTCYFFLDILFHHDFHHDRCDYHWDFYGHSLHFEPHFRLSLPK